MNLQAAKAILDGNIIVQSTSGRGFTPEEIAERALDKIIYIGKETHPAIRDQAEAFKEHIRAVLVFYMKEAIQSDRTTVANRLTEAGHHELTNLLID
jgi:hypothetical protein